MAANPVPIPDLKIEAVTTPEDLVRCTGKITSTSDMLQTTVRGPIPEAKRVVLDLTDVSYMDSSGLGRLLLRQTTTMRVEAHQREPAFEGTVANYKVGCGVRGTPGVVGHNS